MSFGKFQFRRQGRAYSNCFTIDPTKGAEAWEKLTQNQMGLEIGMLPKTLHEALVQTLTERQSLNKVLER